MVLAYVSAMALSGATATASSSLQVSGGAATDLEQRLDEVAKLSGEPGLVSAAGVTRDETPLLTLENPTAFDTSSTKRRLVIVGGLDGAGAGPTRRYYLDRPAVSGGDDRGGAMALGAALEIYQLTE